MKSFLKNCIKAGIFLIFSSPAPLFAASGCTYPTSLDSFADKVSGDYFTISDVNKMDCVLEALQDEIDKFWNRSTGEITLDNGGATSPELLFVSSSGTTFYVENTTGSVFKFGKLGGAELLGLLDTTLSDGETALELYIHDGVGATVAEVTLGATDSGGSGYKVLRVPNSHQQ